MGDIIFGHYFEPISIFVKGHYMQLVFGYTLFEKTISKFKGSEFKLDLGYNRLKNHFEKKNKLKKMDSKEKMHYDYIKKIEGKLNKIREEVNKTQDNQIKRKTDIIITNTENILKLYYENNKIITNRVDLKGALDSTENILEQFTILSSYSTIKSKNRAKIIKALDHINGHIKWIMNSNLENNQLELDVEMNILESRINSINLFEDEIN